jgi:hypothetical protein
MGGESGSVAAGSVLNTTLPRHSRSMLREETITREQAMTRPFGAKCCFQLRNSVPWPFILLPVVLLLGTAQGRYPVQTKTPDSFVTEITFSESMTFRR